MVSPTFSEFQFSYGLTRELEGPKPGMGLIDLPRIPTQHQEAEIPADLISTLRSGDTEIAPLFIQYKRPEKMIRSNAGQWDDLERMGIDLSDGYFRFRPYLGDTNQHNKLVRLGSRQPLVFYVSPMFIKHGEYRRHAANGQIYENTAFIQCGELKTISDEDHYITYTPNGHRGLMKSEPSTFTVRTGVEGAFIQDEIERGLNSFDSLRSTFDEIREELVSVERNDRGRWDNYFPEPHDYDANEPIEWIGLQQQFLRDTAGADLLFFTDTDG